MLIRGMLSPSVANVANTAAVFSATPDPDLTNNSSSIVIPIGNLADLAVTKVACPNPVAPCGTVTYTMIVSNGGPGDAVGVVLTDVLPDEICRGQYSINGGQSWQTWNGSVLLGNLNAGSSVTVLIKGVVLGCAVGSMTNVAAVSSATIDPQPGNNQFAVTTRIKHCRRRGLRRLVRLNNNGGIV